MAANSLHISISAETLFNIGPLPVTNSMVTSIIASAVLILFAVVVRSGYDSNKTPRGIQNLAEFIVESLYNLVQGITNSTKKTMMFFPVLATFFLFIVMNNWIGLLPGVGTVGIIEQSEEVEHVVDSSLVPQAHAETVIEDDHAVIETDEVGAKVADHEESATKFIPIFRAGTADLNMTIALAVISQVLAQVFGFYQLGFGYLKKFFNFSNPINFFVGILEFLGEFTKIISYAFRLFGNVFAGEVLLAVIAFLVPVIVPMPFYALELFVGLIQALVFTMLSLVFFNLATIGHDDH